MIHLRAPAKLNLYLRVLGKRPDGYHEVETVFERIDLADELTFEPHPSELRLTCSDLTLSCGEDNLVVKTARLLQTVRGTHQGARMHLTKRIPIAAGLGGGSSDAATTLLGLNELWGLGLGRAQLVELAAQLGSDVPFFLSMAPFAIGRGRGERCEPVAETRMLAHVLVVPDERLSTKDIYEAFDQRIARARFDPSTRPSASLRVVPSESLDSAVGLARDKCRAKSRHEQSESRDDLTIPNPSSTMVLHALRNGSLGELAKGLWNDLEPEAIRRCPVISLIQLALRQLGCLGTRISGSGPSVFGLCHDAAHAQELAARLSAPACVASPNEAAGAQAGLRQHAAQWRVEISQTDHPSLEVTPSAS